MSMSTRRTIVGVFEDHRKADQAVTDLKASGFRADQIGVAMRQPDGGASTGLTTDATATAEDNVDSASEGAMAGVLAGLGMGALAGLGVLAGVIPVIGPAIAGGTLGILLSNAALGAGVAGLAGALIGAGVPEEEATYYHEEFEAGRTIVTVQADDRAAEAHAILRAHGAYDLSSRPSGVGSATSTGSTLGTSSARAASTPAAGSTAGRSTASTGHAGMGTSSAGGKIEVREERLHAETTPVQTGEVRVRKEVHTETKHLEVPVQREEVIIERTPVAGRPASTTAGTTLGAGEELRIPVREEQVHVSKEAVVTEEVSVGKRVVRDTEHVTGEVRKEDVRIESTGDVDVRNRGGSSSTGGGKPRA